MSAWLALTAAASMGAVVPPVPPAAPVWLILADASRPVLEAAARIERAAALAVLTPTGAPLARQLSEAGGRVRVEPYGSLMVQDRDNAVIAGADFVAERSDAFLAVQLAHELEHLRQREIGVTGENARAARELGAFLVEARVWAELGGPVGGRSRDHEAWGRHPWSAMTALALRVGYRLDLSLPEVRRYWEDSLGEEAAWRASFKGRLPASEDSAQAALFVLRQAFRFVEDAPPGDISPWLAQALEAAGSLGAGEAFVLPGSPTERDRAAFEAFPGKLELRGESGGWVLTRAR